jgi:hypothetical protein
MSQDPYLVGADNLTLPDPHLDNSDAFYDGRSPLSLCIDDLDKYGYLDTRLSKRTFYHGSSQRRNRLVTVATS